jgi:hypothetical protein
VNDGTHRHQQFISRLLIVLTPSRINASSLQMTQRLPFLLPHICASCLPAFCPCILCVLCHVEDGVSTNEALLLRTSGLTSGLLRLTSRCHRHPFPQRPFCMLLHPTRMYPLTHDLSSSPSSLSAAVFGVLSLSGGRGHRCLGSHHCLGSLFASSLLQGL